MQDPTARVISILMQYMRDLGEPVATWTRFGDLGIDRMDLPMIVLDLEDVFAIQIRYGEELDGLACVGDLVACVSAHLEAQASRPRTPLAPRSKRPWMSTAA